MVETTVTGTPAWVPAITALLGFITAVVVDWLKDARSYKRERESREASERAVLDGKQAEFQRDTLLALQKVAQIVMHSITQMHYLDVMALRSGKGWHTDLYPEELDRRAHQAAMETIILGARVRDPKVRELLKSFSDEQTQTFRARGEDESLRGAEGAAKAFASLNERIGEVLRSIDES